MPRDLAAAPAWPPAPSRLATLAYAVAATALALDQTSKWWVLSVLDLDRRAPVPLGLGMRLTYVPNPGISYGLLRADGAVGRWLLVLFSLAVAAALAVWAWRTPRQLAALGFGLVMGGAVGNALDRARLGVVTDFVDISALHFPWVFNVADSAITVGVILLLADSLTAAKTT